MLAYAGAAAAVSAATAAPSSVIQNSIAIGRTTYTEIDTTGQCPCDRYLELPAWDVIFTDLHTAHWLLAALFHSAALQHDVACAIAYYPHMAKSSGMSELTQACHVITRLLMQL